MKQKAFSTSSQLKGQLRGMVWGGRREEGSGWGTKINKGDQSWVFIGRTDAKAETPILWPPHAKS